MGGGAGEFIETERKYEVGPDFAPPDLTGLEPVAAVSPPQTHQLSAVYFDTADLRLAAARITLRRRTGGTDAGWHLKLPAGAESRQEVHAPLGEATAKVPAALAGRVSAWTGGQPLQPIARLDTTRVVHHLTGPGDQVLAEIADDRVTGLLPAPDATGTGVAAPGDAGLAGAGLAGADLAGAGAQGQPRWQQASRWREVEVELAAGPRDLLDAVGERLLQAGAAPSAAASKLSRLLAARHV